PVPLPPVSGGPPGDRALSLACREGDPGQPHRRIESGSSPGRRGRRLRVAASATLAQPGRGVERMNRSGSTARVLFGAAALVLATSAVALAATYAARNDTTARLADQALTYGSAESMLTAVALTHS